MEYLPIPTYTFYHENQPFMWINISAPWILWDRTIYNIPGGGNSNLFNVHPEPWGRWTQFDYSNIFSKGVGKNHQLGNHCHFIEIEGGLTKKLRDFSKKSLLNSHTSSDPYGSVGEDVLSSLRESRFLQQIELPCAAFPHIPRCGVPMQR